MKNVFLSFSLIFLCPYLAFTQLDTTRMLEYRYNPDAGEWLVWKELNQEFSGEIMTLKSEKIYGYQNSKSSVFQHKLEIYNDFGQPIAIIDSSFNETGLNLTYFDYFYEENNLDEVFYYKKFPHEAVLKLINRTKYYYNPEGLIERKERISQNGNGISSISMVCEYLYDENGCLIQEIIEPPNQVHQKTIFTRDGNCNLISKVFFDKPDFENFEPSEKITYHEFMIDGNRLLVDSFFYGINSGGAVDWVFINTEEREFNENQQLVRNKEIENFSWAREEVWTYHASGEILTYQESNINSWDSSYVAYQNALEFDERGFLIYKNQVWSEDGEFHKMDEFSYENYCNGHPKYLLYSTSRSVFRKQYFFEYREAEDCPDTPDEFATKIYPNPSNGQVTIETDALQENSSYVRVYTMLGQLVFEKFVPNQAFGIRVDLSHLNQGNYLVSVAGNNYAVAEKIVIRAN